MLGVTELSGKQGLPSSISDLKRALLPVTTLKEARLMLPLVEILLQDIQAEVTVLLIAIAPSGCPMSAIAAQASRRREAFCRWLADNTRIMANVKTMVGSSLDLWVGIWGMIIQEKMDLLLLSLPFPGLGYSILTRLVDPGPDQPPCEVIAVRAGQAVFRAQGWEAIERILVPVRDGPKSSLALKMGCVLAECAGAEMTVLHVSNPDKYAEQVRFQEDFGNSLHGIERVTRMVTAKGEVLPAIQEEMRAHQAVVMGAPSMKGGNWRSPLLDAMMQDAEVSLVVVKGCTQLVTSPLEKIRSKYSRSDPPVSFVVDKWFAENTYHSREFADLERLVALKEQQGVTISLGLPALNEEKTVGKVIQTVKRALMDQVPLLDEIVLVDSNSYDSTRQIARDLGVPVYIHQEILPQYGAYDGKGEALWKSLFVLSGDLIVWIDTDIKNIHPRFVYGVLGPLLRDPGVQYVKGFYRRPLKQGGKLVAGGGGRVTELTARPFINLFFPQLSGLIQPLSGEYAGRREALEKLPFFSGYGVETGLLIDILEKFGLNAIAQTDLLERIHHNQPLPSLSKMSFVIMQVVFSRLERRHKVDLLNEANLKMNLIRYRPQWRYFLDPVEIKEHERPPMTTVEEYRCRDFLWEGTMVKTTAPRNNI